MEDISYPNQLNEGFLYIVFVGQIYAFMEGFIYELDLKYTIYFLSIILGNIIPLFIIYKTKKLFPIIIISLIFYILYLIFGVIIFGIRGGEILN